MNSTITRVARDASKAGTLGVDRSAVDRLVVVVPALIFIAASLQYGLIDYALVRDHAYYAYYGFRVAAGDVVYRDLVDNKTPLSMYLSALLVGLARIVGTDPLTTIRVGYLLMSAVVVALTAAILMSAFRDRRLALMGGMLLATFGTLSRLSISGPEPKVPMLMFALLGTLAAQHGRWLLCGVTVGLAGLAWQPGWSFTGVGLVAILATSTRRWRDAAWLLAGVILPVLGAGVYFAWHGALRDAIWQTVVANIVHVPGVPGGSTATGANKLSSIAFIMAAQYHREMLIVAAGFLGLIVLGLDIWAGTFRRMSREAVAFSMGAFTPLVFTAVLGIQGATDTLVVLPSLACFAAYLLVRTTEARPAAAWAFAVAALGFAVVGFLGRSNRLPFVVLAAAAPLLWALAFRVLRDPRAPIKHRTPSWMVGVLMLAVLVYGTVDAARFNLANTRYAQERLFRGVAAQTGFDPTSKVLTIQGAEFLVLTGHQNALRYSHFMVVSRAFFERYERRPLEGITDDLERVSPKLVIIPQQRLDQAAELVRAWVSTRYRHETSFRSAYPEDANAGFTYDVWSRP
ncbi:MAG: hypothetical protein ACRDGN_10445 [bacterium]